MTKNKSDLMAFIAIFVVCTVASYMGCMLWDATNRDESYDKFSCDGLQLRECLKYER